MQLRFLLLQLSAAISVSRNSSELAAKFPIAGQLFCRHGNHPTLQNCSNLSTCLITPRSQLHSLRGQTLTIALVMLAPYSFAGYRDELGFERNVTGLSADMIEAVSQRLGFSYRLVQPKDDQWGAPEENGEWNGMVGEVLRKEVDMAIGPFTTTAIRQNVIDFSSPFMEDSNSIIIRRPGQQNPMFRMLSPFTINSWIAIFISTICTSTFIFLFSRFSPFSRWNMDLTDKIYDEISFKENLWSSVGTLLHQGQEIFPSAPSARTVLACWMLSVVMLTAAYTADMIGYLTLNLPATSIRSIEELANQNAIRPLVKSGASAFTLFQKSATGSTYNKVYQLMDNMPKFTTTKAAIALLKQENSQYAFIDDRSHIRFEALTDCDLLLLPDQFNMATFAWVMHKQANYQHLINKEIERLVSSGLISRWISKWWRADNICDKGADLSEAASVDLLQVSGAFIIFLSFIAIASALLMVERLISSKCRNTAGNYNLERDY